MTVKNAMKFIDEGQVDSDLRKKLYNANTIDEMYKILGDMNLSFSAAQFEEAYTNRLVNCQHEDFAEQLKEFKLWWEMLNQINGGAGSASVSSCETGGSCSTKSCGSCCG
ncbi:MAG: hypothetical protein JXR91_16745 [Deltaproteobacteria bacterium]|nr:hypothetical protein [Deltaproteobacteria bacterium]